MGRVGEDRAAIEARVRARFSDWPGEGWINPHYRLVNKELNDILRSVGSDLRSYVFRENGCFVFGHAKEEVRPVEGIDYYIPRFSSHELTGCHRSSDRFQEGILANYDNKYTVAVFRPWIDEFVRERLAKLPVMTWLPDFFSVAVADQVESYAREHEVNHISDDNVLRVVMGYAGKKFRTGTVPRRNYELYRAVKEIRADVNSIVENNTDRFIYGLVRFYGYQPNLMNEFAQCISGVRSSSLQGRVEAFYGEYMTDLRGIFDQWLLRDGEEGRDKLFQDAVATMLAAEDGDAIAAAPEENQEDRLYAELAKKFWSDRKARSSLQTAYDVAWARLGEIRNNFCPSARFSYLPKIARSTVYE